LKNESTFAKKLDSFLKRIKKTAAADSVEATDALDPIGQLVLGLLQWDSTSTAAKIAYDRLMSSMVDYNDLRVSHAQEVKTILGQRYPKADDRIGRMSTILQEIYVRQHAVLLDGLLRKPKKEIRIYLDSLPGMPLYVSAQVTLLCFNGHAVPVDEVLVALLRREKVVDQEATLEQVQSFLERRVRASDAVDTHAILRHWADVNGPSLVESKSTKVTKSTKTASLRSTKKSSTKTAKTKKDSASKTIKKSSRQPAKK